MSSCSGFMKLTSFTTHYLEFCVIRNGKTVGARSIMFCGWYLCFVFVFMKHISNGQRDLPVTGEGIRYCE